MEITKLRIRNIGRFEDQAFELATPETHDSNVTVFVGNNGAGKTTILESLATSLSWLVAKLQSDRGRGSPISELKVRHGQGAASVSAKLSFLPQLSTLFQYGRWDLPKSGTVFWRTTKTLQGQLREFRPKLAGLSRFTDSYRQLLRAEKDTSLPLIAYYSVERSVIDIPLKIKTKHKFLQLDGYDNALRQGVDFRRFFEWFREREDVENEAALSESALNELEAKLDKSSEAWQKVLEINEATRDSQLTAVRRAIYAFMPGFSNLKVRRSPRLHMSVEKQGERLNVAQLSQGEKSLMALVGDIARRLAMMNPKLPNPLHGDGIVLIDEVELHLHPRLQRSIIRNLTKTFPNCQFVLTTHSPLVISDTKNVLTYLIDEDDVYPVSELYGQDANTVLMEVMHTDIRNADVEAALGDLFDAIHDSQLDAAKQKLEELEAQVPQSNVELSKARLLMRKQALKQSRKDA